MKNNYLTQEEFNWLQQLKGKKVYGIPKNGLIVGLAAGLDMVDNPDDANVILDDISDSGRTLDLYIGKKDIYVLYVKSHTPNKDSLNFYDEKNEWIEFPWEQGENDSEDLVVRILEKIGEDPTRPGLEDTPTRVVKMWKEKYRGYKDTEKPNITVFPNNEDGISYDQMIIDTGYFFSECEHHMAPFFGTYYFAYIPNENVIGLSKVARTIDYFAAKLQVQERLGKEVLDELEDKLKPKGIALILKGRHLCKEMRGVKKHKGEMITSDIRGVFRTDLAAREEFIRLTK